MTSRKHRSKAEWRNLVEQQARSGLNGVAFCEQRGLSRKTFYRHRKMLEEKPTDLVADQFIRVQPAPAQVISAQPSTGYCQLQGQSVKLMT